MVFAEYHAIGSQNAFYMLRDRRYKYVYHVDAPAQLFDLVDDPAEVNDLAIDPDASTRNLLREREDQLRAILDPELTDRARQSRSAATYRGPGRAGRRGRARFIYQFAGAG